MKADETVALELVHEAEISWGVEIDITPDPFHYTGIRMALSSVYTLCYPLFIYHADDDSSEEEKAETPQTFDIGKLT